MNIDKWLGPIGYTGMPYVSDATRGRVGKLGMCEGYRTEDKIFNLM